jgi:heme/copper-type cytochrome/quinol oxidase subunit 3
MIDRLESLDRVNAHKLGMLLFIASEAVFFAVLILAFVYYRPAWIGRPEAGGAHALDVGLTGLFTLLLLGSSVTVWLAERSLRRGDPAGMRRWLLVTVLLGAVFIAGQVLEYVQLYREGITIASGLFGTTFFTLTGFHGLHVLGGLVALATLLGAAQAGAPQLRRPHATALESTSLYWHFVDVVWVFVFGIVYLWTLVSV